MPQVTNNRAEPCRNISIWSTKGTTPIHEQSWSSQHVNIMGTDQTWTRKKKGRQVASTFGILLPF